MLALSNLFGVNYKHVGQESFTQVGYLNGTTMKLEDVPQKTFNYKFNAGENIANFFLSPIKNAQIYLEKAPIVTKIAIYTADILLGIGTLPFYGIVNLINGVSRRVNNRGADYDDCMTETKKIEITELKINNELEENKAKCINLIFSYLEEYFKRFPSNGTIDPISDTELYTELANTMLKSIEKKNVKTLDDKSGKKVLKKALKNILSELFNVKINNKKIAETTNMVLISIQFKNAFNQTINKKTNNARSNNARFELNRKIDSIVPFNR